MATAAALVIQANPFKWNHQAHTIRFHPLRLSPDTNLNNSNLRSCSPIRKDLKLQCFFKKTPDYLTTTIKSELKSGELESDQLQPRNHVHVMVNNLWESSLRALRKSAVGAVLMGLLVMYNPKSNTALAAPIGRVAGSLCRTYIDSVYVQTGRYFNLGHYQDYSRITECYDPYLESATAFYVFCFFVGSFFVALTPKPCDGLDTKLKLIGLAFVLSILYTRQVRTNVVKLQVHFSDTGRELQTELNRIAKNVDGNTYSYEGLSNVLNETVVALSRRLINGYYISGHSSVYSLMGGRQAKTYLNQHSIYERINRKETLVSVNNTKAQNSTCHSSANESKSEDIVVTILVAAKGSYRIPAIKDKQSLKQVLDILLSIGNSDRIRAVEVLWTPQCSSSVAS